MQQSKHFFLKPFLFFFIASLFLNNSSHAQGVDTLVKSLDSLKKETDTVGQVNNIRLSNYNERTKITPKVYFILLADNYKQQATAPFHLRKKGLLRLSEAALGFAALSIADEPIQRFAVNLTNHNPNLEKISHSITNFGGPYETITLAAFATYGFLFKVEKVKTTTFLASQAYLTSATFSAVIKQLFGRQRPNYYDPAKVEQEPTFRGPFAPKGTDAQGRTINSSFPSGHTTAAFSAATVYAMEYRDRPIIPIIAYSAASLIGLSRIALNRHWLTDILGGAGLGYLCGRQVVNNYHRYAKIQNDKRRNKPVVLFNLQYNNGVIMPGLTCNF